MRKQLLLATTALIALGSVAKADFVGVGDTFPINGMTVEKDGFEDNLNNGKRRDERVSGVDDAITIGISTPSTESVDLAGGNSTITPTKGDADFNSITLSRHRLRRASRRLRRAVSFLPLATCSSRSTTSWVTCSPSRKKRIVTSHRLASKPSLALARSSRASQSLPTLLAGSKRNQTGEFWFRCCACCGGARDFNVGDDAGIGLLHFVGLFGMRKRNGGAAFRVAVGNEQQ